MSADAFLRFSEQLYCAGAEERRCPLPNGGRTEAGSCYWRSTTNRTSLPRPTDEWDPEEVGAGGYRRIRRSEANECAHGKRVLLLGDSTTRDTFYELSAVIGRPIWQWARPRDDRHFAQYWPEDQWSPRAPPSTSGASDVSGVPRSLPVARALTRGPPVCECRHVQWK